MTTHWPRHIYREDVLRWEWWLHIILVIVWGMECGRRWLGGIWHSRNAKIKTPKLPISAYATLHATKKHRASHDDAKQGGALT